MALEEIWKIRKKVIQRLGSGQPCQMLIFPSSIVLDKVWPLGSLISAPCQVIMTRTQLKGIEENPR